MPTLSRLRIPHGEREHASEPAEAIDAERPVAGQQHLRVGLGSKLDAARFEIAADVAKVVDLAVEDQPVPSVIADHRLRCGV